jgi:hypothetical protein
MPKGLQVTFTRLTIRFKSYHFIPTKLEYRLHQNTIQQYFGFAERIVCGADLHTLELVSLLEKPNTNSLNSVSGNLFGLMSKPNINSLIFGQW